MENFIKTLVLYPLATQLANIGYNEKCIAFYHLGDLRLRDFTLLYSNGDKPDVGFAAAPSYQQVINWIRKKYEIHIEIYCNNSVWGYILTKLNGTTIKEITDDVFFNQPEIATTIAIEEVIKYMFKGELNGICNVTACKTGMVATWYNHSTEKHYCPECAERLNTDPHNKTYAMREFGHNLCTNTTNQLKTRQHEN